MTSLSKWILDSWDLHRNLSYELGSRIWDEFKYPEDEVHLFHKIGVAFFGGPKSSDNSDQISEEPKFSDLGLEEKHVKMVENIIEKCCKYSYDKQKIKIAVIFVSVYKSSSFMNVMPLIRVMTSPSKSVEVVPKSTFIDLFGRVYDNFNNFLETHTWDNCYICFPKNGYYKINLTICIKKPETKDKVLDVADKVSNVLNISTAASMLTGIALSCFPPTAPIGLMVTGYSAIAGAPGAVYGVGRSVGKIVDRSTHEQSISLLDSEARQCWLVTASAIVSVGALASTKILTSMATSGRTLSMTARGACTGMNLASVGMSGLSVVNSAYELSQKEGEVTKLEIIQLTTSIFFLTHSVVSFKTAKTIIQEAQQNELARMRSSISPEHQEKYDFDLQNVKKNFKEKSIPVSERDMHGQAEFIRKMKKIDNPNEYFSNIKVTAKGNYCLNKKLSITPKKFLKLSDHERETLINSSKDLQDKKITLKAFNKKVQPIVRKYRIFVRKGVNQSNLNNSSNINNTTQTISDNKNYSGINTKKNKTNGIVLSSSKENRFFYQMKKTVNIILTFIKGLHKKKPEITEKIIEIIKSEIKHKVLAEIKRRLQENSDPGRPSGTDPKGYYLSQVCEDFQIEGNPLNSYLNSLFDLAASCDNIKVPKECFKVILDMIKLNIHDIHWQKSNNVLLCFFTADNFIDYKVEIHLIENIHYVFLYEITKIEIEKMQVYEINNFVSKIDGDLRDYLTVLEESCKENNIHLPRECFEVLLETSQGIAHNVIWNKTGNLIQSTFTTSIGQELTMDFHISNTKFIVHSYENHYELLGERICEKEISNENTKSEDESESEDDSDDEADDSLQFLAYLVRKIAAKKRANEIVNTVIKTKALLGCLTDGNIEIINEYTSNKFMEEDFKRRNGEMDRSDSLEMENEYLASMISRDFITPYHPLNDNLMSYISLVMSYQRNRINTPKQCLEFIMEYVQERIDLNRIKWIKNDNMVQCHYNSLLGNTLKMDFNVTNSSLVAEFILGDVEEIKIYDLNTEDEYPEYLLDNDTTGL